MPSSLIFMKRGMSSPLESFFMRSKSSSSAVTLSILIVVSLPPVAPLPGTTATTLFSTKPAASGASPGGDVDLHDATQRPAVVVAGMPAIAVGRDAFQPDEAQAAPAAAIGGDKRHTRAAARGVLEGHDAQGPVLVAAEYM